MNTPSAISDQRQVVDKNINELEQSPSTNSPDVQSKDSNSRKNRRIIFAILLLLVLLMGLGVIFALQGDKNKETILEEEVGNTSTVEITETPEIKFDRYSDDYLEFEYPVGAEVEVQGGDVYHPSQIGRTITGVNYLSIKQPGKFILENYHILQGGGFDHVFYDQAKGILGRYDYTSEVEYGYEVVETKLTQKPEITTLTDISGYLVKVKELEKIYLMYRDPEEPEIFRSVNFGLWTKLEYLGKFAEETDLANFLGFSCTIDKGDESDYDYCEQILNRFLATVTKKFEENEKYVPPKVEGVLEMRDRVNGDVTGSYKFSMDEKEHADTYLSSNGTSLSVINVSKDPATLTLRSFETYKEIKDIAFWDLRDTIPSFDVGSTNIFRNLIYGEDLSRFGTPDTTSFQYTMYYPDEEKTICTENGPVGIDDYIGCISRKLKIKGVEGQLEATCTYAKTDTTGIDTCDKMISGLRIEKVS